MALSNVNKWYGKWNALFDEWEVSPYEVNVACKENEGQLSYHASFSKGKHLFIIAFKLTMNLLAVLFMDDKSFE